MRKRVFVNPVIGDKATLLKSSEETNGEYTLMEIELLPGGGNTLHFHDSFSEKFTVVDGSLTVQVNDKVLQLEEGESHTVTKHQLHCFKNNTNKDVKFQIELRPGNVGFENFIAILYGLAADGETDKRSIPKKFTHLAILAHTGGTVPQGFLQYLMPIFKWKANRAKATHLSLIEKYC